MQILLKRYLILRHFAYVNSEFISSITFTDEWIFGMFLMNLFRFCAVNVLSHHECSYRLVKVSMDIFLIAFLYTEKTQTKVWRLHFGEQPFSGGWRWPRLFEKILNDCQFWRYKLNFTMYSDSSSHIIVLFLRNWFYFPSKIILLKALATEKHQLQSIFFAYLTLFDWCSSFSIRIHQLRSQLNETVITLLEKGLFIESLIMKFDHRIIVQHLVDNWKYHSNIWYRNFL